MVFEDDSVTNAKPELYRRASDMVEHEKKPLGQLSERSAHHNNKNNSTSNEPSKANDNGENESS